MELLYNTSGFDYYAFCDQDDVWLPDKLRIAVSELISHVNEPALYFSRRIIVDASLKPIGIDDNEYCYTLGESFLRNPAAGCTMVFNSKLHNILLLYKCSTVYMHDAWVYKICLCLNEYLYPDTSSYILYRLHRNNTKSEEYILIMAKALCIFCAKRRIEN